MSTAFQIAFIQFHRLVFHTNTDWAKQVDCSRTAGGEKTASLLVNGEGKPSLLAFIRKKNLKQEQLEKISQCYEDCKLLRHVPTLFTEWAHSLVAPQLLPMDEPFPAAGCALANTSLVSTGHLPELLHDSPVWVACKNLNSIASHGLWLAAAVKQLEICPQITKSSCLRAAELSWTQAELQKIAIAALQKVWFLNCKMYIRSFDVSMICKTCWQCEH